MLNASPALSWPARIATGRMKSASSFIGAAPRLGRGSSRGLRRPPITVGSTEIGSLAALITGQSRRVAFDQVHQHVGPPSLVPRGTGAIGTGGVDWDVFLLRRRRRSSRIPFRLDLRLGLGTE